MYRMVNKYGVFKKKFLEIGNEYSIWNLYEVLCKFQEIFQSITIFSTFLLQFQVDSSIYIDVDLLKIKLQYNT